MRTSGVHPRLQERAAVYEKKCSLSYTKIEVVIKSITRACMPGLTFGSVSNCIIERHGAWQWSLDADMPLTREEYGDRDETVPGGGPEVLDHEIFSPLVCYSELKVG